MLVRCGFYTILIILGLLLGSPARAADEYLLYDDPILKLEVARYVDQGMGYVEKQEFENAIEAYSKALSYPENSMTYIIFLNRGSAHVELQHYPAAQQDFERAIVLHPTDPLGHYRLALFYFETDQWAKLVAPLTTALDLGLHDQYKVLNEGESYYIRGNAYTEIGEYEQGIADLNRAIKLGFKPAEVYHDRGYTYETLGRYREAERDYTTSLEVDPGNPVGLLRRGTVLRCLGQEQQAIRDYTKILDQDPQDAEARFQRGSTLLEIDEYAAALEDLHYGSTPYLDHSYAALMVAEAYFQMGRLSEALEANATTLKREEPDVQVRGYFQRGYLLLTQGRIPEAQAAYQEGLTRAKASETLELRVAEALRGINKIPTTDPQVAGAKAEIMTQLKQVYDPPPESLKRNAWGCKQPLT